MQLTRWLALQWLMRRLAASWPRNPTSVSGHAHSRILTSFPSRNAPEFPLSFSVALKAQTGAQKLLPITGIDSCRYKLSSRFALRQSLGRTKIKMSPTPVNECPSDSLIARKRNSRREMDTRRQLEPRKLTSGIRMRSFRILGLRTQLVLVTLALFASNRDSRVECQCPNNTMTSFERIGGVKIPENLPILYKAPNTSATVLPNGQKQIFAPGSSNSELTRNGFATSMGPMMSAAGIPITAECNNRCRRSAKCRAFLVDYARHTCYQVEHQSNQIGSLRSPAPINLVPTEERTAYFEKVCLNLREPAAFDCERAWMYERVKGFQVLGFDDKIIEDVASRIKCQEHCLNEREFRCRSGEYDYITMQCRLSTADRHLKPSSFRPTTQNVDYFENQCVPVGNQCDAFDRFEDLDLGRAEIMRAANTSDQCQQFCTQIIKAFICRSFTWDPLLGRCYLNSANTFMVGGADKLISAPGLTYYQRNDCIDLKLDCDTTAMTLNLRTNEPFEGRMYVRDDPNACETMGRSALSSSLSIPFQPQGRCAQRELPSRYSSVVVVQQHPLIQRKSDRYIKVVCDFQTSNRTITSTYNVAANPWTSTALINSTSFAPKIRLRITDKFGIDITGAKLGDELYLRIEAETESVYDMVARSVLAKSGTTDETIELIDKDGCPTDFRIFPALKKLNRRTIVGKFDAFKFSSDVVVRFQVDVQFCLNQCPLTSCDQSLHLLNTNAGQLSTQPDTYSSGSLTTPGPPPTPMGVAAQSDGGASLETVATQPPAPSFQQRHGAMDQPLVSYPAKSAPSPYGVHTLVPANQPLGNFTQLDGLRGSGGGDSQTFDGTQARNLQQGKSLQQDHSVKGSLELVAGGADAADLVAVPNVNSHTGGEPAHLNRRHRRSTEPMPSEPRHVPLQREIIVESAPSSPDSKESAAAGGRQKVAKRNGQSQRDARKTGGVEAGELNRNGPTYDMSGGASKPNQLPSSQERQQVDNRTLLCTTRHSLVLASLAFCAVQLLTISMCLVTWLHKKDTKLKLGHPIDERLY